MRAAQDVPEGQALTTSNDTEDEEFETRLRGAAKRPMCSGSQTLHAQTAAHLASWDAMAM